MAPDVAGPGAPGESDFVPDWIAGGQDANTAGGVPRDAETGGIGYGKSVDVTAEDDGAQKRVTELSAMSIEGLVNEMGFFGALKRVLINQFRLWKWGLLFGVFFTLCLLFLGIFCHPFQHLGWMAWFTFGVIELVLVVLIRPDINPALPVVLAGVVLLAFFVIDTDDALSGFAQTGVATVLVLYGVAEAITRTSVLVPINKVLLGRPTNFYIAQLRLIPANCVFSAFINNTPQMAVMIPVVQAWSRRNGFPVSRLLMPLNAACLLGGTLAMLGTSTNFVVQGFAEDSDLKDEAGNDITFPMFEIGKVGSFYAVVGCIYCMLAARFLPRRTGQVEKLIENPREYTVALRVEAKSAIVGGNISDAGLRHLAGLYLVELVRENGDVIPAPSNEVMVEPNDVMVFAGIVETVTELYHIPGIVPATRDSQKMPVQYHKRVLVEVVLSPTSSLVGHTVRDTHFRSEFNAAIIAISRHGGAVKERIGSVVLQGGDTLLLETGPNFLRRHRRDRCFALVSPVNDSTPPREDLMHMILAAIILIAVIVIATVDVGEDLLTLALIGLFLCVWTGCVTWAQVVSALSLDIVLTIAASFALSAALDNSGAAAACADAVVGLFQPLGDAGIIAGIYCATALVSTIVTNNAAVALMFPVIADPSDGVIKKSGVGVKAALYAIMLAASASFMTPIGYQTNLMIHGPGGYTLLDWVGFGLPLNVILAVIGTVGCYFLYPKATK